MKKWANGRHKVRGFKTVATNLLWLFSIFFKWWCVCMCVCGGRPSMLWPTCRNLRLTPIVSPHLLPCLGDRIRCLVLLMAALPGSWTSREPPAFAPTSQEELWYYDSTVRELAVCESWSHKCFTHQDVSSALLPSSLAISHMAFR